MAQSLLVELILYATGAVLAATSASLLMRRFAAPVEKSELRGDALVFLVRGNTLIDANFPARRALSRIHGPAEDIDRLRLFLAREFENAEALWAPPGATGDLAARSRDGRVQVQRQVAPGAVRLKLTAVDGAPGSEDVHTLRALDDELETLRANTMAAPFLLWRQNSAGEVTWVNQAYLDAVREIFGAAKASDWPIPAIFPALKTLSSPRVSESRRLVATRRDGEEAWYDCHISTVGHDILCTAMPADEAVRSENRRREFTQTLTKTFAELATGLAIFDRSRRLVLFNPALLDLTNLPTDFLTSRPSLVGFLDRLRENRVMPEPRDYRAWRTSIAELEAAAADGTYSETWSLPDGQTYHVTGRPHPDGAVALLFEDISAEMSLTRRFRAELEQSQAIIDALEDGVAVFSAAGHMTLSNRAYHALWRMDPEENLTGTGLTEATRQWLALSIPTPVWGDFRDFAQQTLDREEWTATVTLRDGRAVFCRFIPQRGGATMAIFRVEAASHMSEALPRAV